MGLIHARIAVGLFEARATGQKAQDRDRRPLLFATGNGQGVTLVSGLEGGEQAVELRSFRASGSHLPDASRDHLRMFSRSPNGSTPKSICTNSGNIQRSTLFYRKALITGKFYGPSVRDSPTFPGLWRPRDWDGDVSNVRFDPFHGPRSHRLFRMP